MSTRSLTHVHDEDGSILLTFYRQSDGYPEGIGLELAKFLKPLAIVNGLSGSACVANGMPCLAAQLIAHLKDGPGGVYIYPAGAEDCGEEYCYRVKLQKEPAPKTAFNHVGVPLLEVYDVEGAYGRPGRKIVHTLLFSGTPAEVAAAIQAKAAAN